MSKLATVIIPVSNAHYESGIYEQAAASAHAQTIPVEVYVVRDRERKGAAWARNRGARQAKSPFLIFLDADDTLAPEFLERTVQVYKQGYYVYTNYYLNGEPARKPPPHLQMQKVGMQHIITTLLPTVAWESVGGFDESWSGPLEDEDFFRRVHIHGWCGVHCDEYLVNYNRKWGHSAANIDTEDADRVQARIIEAQAKFNRRYGHMKVMDCNCNPHRQLEALQNLGKKHPNDVLCAALYDPRIEVGPITKRSYPRTGHGALLWVDRDDQAAKPRLWQYVGEPPESISPDVESVMRLAQLALERKPHINPTPVADATNATPAPLPLVEDTVSISIDIDLKSLTKGELHELADVSVLEVVGTGRRGYKTKEDYIKALEAFYQERGYA